MNDLPLVLRELRPGDVAYVVSTWAQSVPAPFWMPRAKYLSNVRRCAALTLKRAARVVVLASSEHDSTIMGWSCGDDGMVHHAYVRPQLRGPAARGWVDALIGAAMGVKE